MSATVSPTQYAPPVAPPPIDLAERLRDPATIAAVSGLLDRVDRLTQMVDVLSAAAERAPAAVATITDMADDAYRAAAAHDVDLDARLHLLLRLAEQLSAPRTVEVLSALLDRVDAVERLLAAADAAPGGVAMAVDIADDLMRQAQASGLDVEKGLVQGAGAAIRFGAMMGPEQVASVEQVLRSGLLEPQAVRVVGSVGAALAAASTEEPARVGPLGLLRALRDPDVQRAVGLLLRVAAAFGRDVARPAAARSPSIP